MARFLAVAVIVLPLTVVTIIFGELVPKVFALGNREWVCLRLSPLMEWFSWCVWPAVWALETSVSLIVRVGERQWKGRRGDASAPALQELRAIAALARTSRLIGRREEGIIVSAARLSSTTLEAIMLPVAYIRYLYVEDSLDEALAAARHDMHTRYPVTDRKEDPQRFIGYANFKDIVAAEAHGAARADAARRAAAADVVSSHDHGGRLSGTADSRAEPHRHRPR